MGRSRAAHSFHTTSSSGLKCGGGVSFGCRICRKKHVNFPCVLQICFSKYQYNLAVKRVEFEVVLGLTDAISSFNFLYKIK